MKENSMSEAVDEKTGAAAPETGVKAADAGQEDMQGTEKQEKSKPDGKQFLQTPSTRAALTAGCRR